MESTPCQKIDGVKVIHFTGVGKIVRVPRAMTKLGRKPNTKMIKKVHQLRKKGLSFRAIMRVMNKKDVKTIFRWAAMHVG